MSGRSSLRNAIARCCSRKAWGAIHFPVIIVALACGCNRAPAPEANPADVVALADRMVANSPVPAALPTCTRADLQGSVTMTFRTLQLLAGHTFDRARHETADWVNPTVLDAVQTRTMLEGNVAIAAKRQAAAALLAADSWIIYRVDLVNAPMALGVKELKTGTISGRIIRYDRRSGRPTCVSQWGVQNSREKTQWAISISNMPYIDPAVAQVLREDLAAHYIAHIRDAALSAR